MIEEKRCEIESKQVYQLLGNSFCRIYNYYLKIYMFKQTNDRLCEYDVGF